MGGRDPVPGRSTPVSYLLEILLLSSPRRGLSFRGVLGLKDKGSLSRVSIVSNQLNVPLPSY